MSEELKKYEVIPAAHEWDGEDLVLFRARDPHEAAALYWKTPVDYDELGEPVPGSEPPRVAVKVQELRPANVSDYLARALISHLELADNEELIDPDLRLDWERPVLELDDSSSDALRQLLADAMARFGGGYPGRVQRVMEPAGDPWWIEPEENHRDTKSTEGGTGNESPDN